MAEIKKDTKKDRSFGLVIGLLFLCVLGFNYLHEHHLNFWILAVGVLFAVISLAKPSWISPFRIVMEKIGHWLGIVNTYILLTIIYVLFFIPLSLIFKLTGKDSLKLKWNKGTKSYWIDSQKKQESSMKNQF